MYSLEHPSYVTTLSLPPSLPSFLSIIPVYVTYSMKIAHAAELNRLRQEYGQKIETEKLDLEKESDTILTSYREKLAAERTKEETKLKQQHEQAMAALASKYRELEEDEEARLEEKKQDFLRTLTRKVLLPY